MNSQFVELYWEIEDRFCIFWKLFIDKVNIRVENCKFLEEEWTYLESFQEESDLITFPESLQ